MPLFKYIGLWSHNLLSVSSSYSLQYGSSSFGLICRAEGEYLWLYHYYDYMLSLWHTCTICHSVQFVKKTLDIWGCTKPVWSGAQVLCRYKAGPCKWNNLQRQSKRIFRQLNKQTNLQVYCIYINIWLFRFYICNYGSDSEKDYCCNIANNYSLYQGEKHSITIRLSHYQGSSTNNLTCIPVTKHDASHVRWFFPQLLEDF